MHIHTVQLAEECGELRVCYAVVTFTQPCALNLMHAHYLKWLFKKDVRESGVLHLVQSPTLDSCAIRFEQPIQSCERHAIDNQTRKK